MIKYKKTIAIMLAIVFLTMVAYIAVPSINKKEEQSVILSKEDKQIAQQIANNSGVTIDKITELRAANFSWNDIIDAVKYLNHDRASISEREKNFQNISEDFYQELLKKGYAKEAIEHVQGLVERLKLNLSEINVYSINEKESSHNFNELLSKIEDMTAIEFILYAKDSLGAFTQAMDEYILALQLDIDPLEYINNIEAYEKQKQEKRISLSDIMTYKSIEDKVLQLLTQEQFTPNDNVSNDNSNSSNGLKAVNQPINSLPENPKPIVEKPSMEIPNAFE